MKQQIIDLVANVLIACNDRKWRPTKQEKIIVGLLGSAFIKRLSNPVIRKIALDDLKIVRDFRPDLSDATVACFIRLADEGGDFLEVDETGWEAIFCVMQASDWCEKLRRFQETGEMRAFINAG